MKSISAHAALGVRAFQEGCRECFIGGTRCTLETPSACSRHPETDPYDLDNPSGDGPR